MSRRDMDDPEYQLEQLRRDATGRDLTAITGSLRGARSWLWQIEQVRQRTSVDPREAAEAADRAELRIGELQRIYDLMIRERWDTYDPARDPEVSR